MEGESVFQELCTLTESSFQTRPATRNTGGKQSDHRDHHPAFCYSAATDFFSRARARQPKMKPGGNCPITTCIGPHISINAAKNGLPNGIAFVATTPSHWNTPCFNTSQPTRVPTAWAQNLDHRLAQQRTWVGLHQRHQHSNMHANRLANSNGRGHIPTKPCHTTLVQARATRAQPPRPHR